MECCAVVRVTALRSAAELLPSPASRPACCSVADRKKERKGRHGHGGGGQLGNKTRGHQPASLLLSGRHSMCALRLVHMCQTAQELAAWVGQLQEAGLPISLSGHVLGGACSWLRQPAVATVRQPASGSHPLTWPPCSLGAPTACLCVAPVVERTAPCRPVSRLQHLWSPCHPHARRCVQQPR